MFTLKSNHSRYFALVWLVASCAMTACVIPPGGYFGTIVAPKEQKVVVGNHSEPRSLDAHKTTGVAESNIIKELFEGLTVYHPQTLEPLPGSAVSWESQNDAQVWIFHLRHNSRWSDGHPVTAHDYVYAWRRAVDPETASPYVALMFYLKNAEAISNGEMGIETLGVQAVDDFTLRVEMEHPTAFFIKLTAHFMFVPLPEWTIKRHGAQWVEPAKIVTNGPFTLAEHRPNDVIVLRKSATYWDAATVKLNEISFLPVNDAAAMNLYKAGELDVMTSGLIPLPFMKIIQTKQDYCTGAFFSTYYYSINVTRKPFDNPLVRKALNLSINKREIAEKLFNGIIQPATMLIPPGIPGYPVLKGPDFNPPEAQRLLAEAGFPDGKGFPKFTIYYNTQESHKQIAETIQRMWKENLGLTVELQNEEWQTFQARWDRRDFDVCRDVWQGDYLDPTTFLDIYQTENLNNHSGWLDPKYGGLLKQASTESDPAKRLQILAEAENYLIDQVPLIPIYFYTNSFMTKPFVKGYHVNLLDTHQMKFVSIQN